MLLSPAVGTTKGARVKTGGEAQGSVMQLRPSKAAAVSLGHGEP